MCTGVIFAASLNHCAIYGIAAPLRHKVGTTAPSRHGVIFGGEGGVATGLRAHPGFGQIWARQTLVPLLCRRSQW